MKLCFEGERFRLAGGQTVGLHDQRGAQIEVLDGDLWVTQEGDRRDVVLHHGERFEVERRGTTVLHALTPAEIRVAPKRRRAWRARGRRWLEHLTEAGVERARRSAYRL